MDIIKSRDFTVNPSDSCHINCTNKAEKNNEFLPQRCNVSYLKKQTNKTKQTLWAIPQKINGSFLLNIILGGVGGGGGGCAGRRGQK